MRGIGAANERVQHEQIEKPHQRFDSLDDIGDAFGLQRVDEPHEGDGQGQRGRRLSKEGAEPGEGSSRRISPYSSRPAHYVISRLVM